MRWRSGQRGAGARGTRASGHGLTASELAVIAAFAETMAPGEHGLPAAEREVPVAATLAEFATRLSPRQARFIAAGVRAFEWLRPPRRFSRLSPAERAVRLERIARSRSPLDRELLMLMKTLFAGSYSRDPRVIERIGFEAGCAVEGEPPPEPSGLGPVEPEGEGEQCDYAIVGSGAGGAAAAVALAEAGHDVLVLEAGPYVDRRSYPEDAVEAMSLYRGQGLTLAEGLPPIPVPAGRMVGGTTVINSGTCFRAPDAVLASWRDEYGLSWASELESEFAEAERMLAIATPPLERLGRNGNLVAAGAGALGLKGAPLARNAGACVQCSSCPQGCRLDAKRGMNVSYLPRAVAAGARVRSGVEARAIELDGARARGLSCAVLDGEGERAFSVEARRGVVLAAGSFGTPELLLRSGIGGPAVGRNLRLHPSSWVGARFEQPVRGWEGIMQSYGVDEWAAQGVMLEATFTPLAFAGQWLPGVGATHQERLAAFDHLGANGVQVRDEQSSGRVELDRAGRLRIRYRLRRREARRLAFGIARAAEIWFAAGAQEVYPQISGNPILGPHDAPRLDSAPPRGRQLRLEAFHPMGSCRIGSDPGTTVADPSGAVRGSPGLYLADASIFPTALGVNPMVTIIAAASRIAAGIADRAE